MIVLLKPAPMLNNKNKILYTVQKLLVSLVN